MRIIRLFLGAIILFLNRIFSPKSVTRDPAQQASVDRDSDHLKLYQFEACPFCVKVRRAMKRYALPIETRNAQRCATSREELLAGGGKLKVPCLRIEDEQGDVNWMYESKDIIAYLEQRFIAQPQAH